MANPTPINNREDAAKAFLAIVRKFGVHWQANVPTVAYETMALCNKHLNERDRRALFTTGALPD